MIESGKVNVRTVSTTRQAAMVNWLVAERGWQIFACASDEDIESAWHSECGTSRIAPVIISESAGL